MTPIFQVRTQINGDTRFCFPSVGKSGVNKTKPKKKKKILPTPALTHLCLPQIDLEPEGKVYVVIDLSGSSTEGNHNTEQHNSTRH